VEFRTLLDKIDAVGHDVNGGGGDASKCAVQWSGENLVMGQEATPSAEGLDSIIGSPGSYPVK
jgi:hypothetical protein